MSFIIEKEEIEMEQETATAGETETNQATATAGEPDNNQATASETDTDSETDNNQATDTASEPEIIIKEKKKYSFTPARAKALAKGRLTRSKNLAINKLKLNKVKEENEKNRLMKLISEMNLIPAKHKKKTRFIVSSESESDNEDNNYNSGYF